MTEFLYYILKASICSGILFTYYYIALRNKQFHQWNRFYLLLSVIIALIAPLLHIPFLQFGSEDQNQSFRLLNVVKSANNYLDEITISSHNAVPVNEWILIGYITFSIIVFIPFITALFRIIRNIKSHRISYINHIRFISTNVKGSPFSFLQYIVWNSEIDLDTDTGKKIFEHELIHVKEKHSIDKLFIQSVLLFFWINPFFWLIRKELNMVHEFIADHKSIGENNTAAFASMILHTAHPKVFNSLTNQFFQSSIKRRLAMITKNHNRKINYLSRIIALPVIVITFFAFTLKAKPVNADILLSKPIIVVIDPGHGYVNGEHTGTSAAGKNEDDINLAIAKEIKDLNKDANIQIILTRTDETNVDLKKRVGIAQDDHANMFISIHLNASVDNKDENGIEVNVSNRNTSLAEENRKLGSALVSTLSTQYKTNPELQYRSNGVYVLDKSPCPSALIECGYFTNSKDRDFILDKNNQRLLAEEILKGIKLYAKGEANQTTSFNYTDKNSSDTSKPDPLLVVDGKIMGRFSKNKNKMGTTDPSNIYSINVLKGPSATKKYGAKGKDGVIEITSKDPNKPVLQKKTEVSSANPSMDNDAIFTKVENEASIDQELWRKYLEEHLQPIITDLNKSTPPGKYTVMIQFLITTEGKVKEVKALNDPGYSIASKVVDMIATTSPDWQPAVQNGKTVNSYHNQPITLVLNKS
jgi:N-acetylmuramoyl-L-alanine amidase